VGRRGDGGLTAAGALQIFRGTYINGTGAISGWQTLGSWTVVVPVVTVDLVTLGSGLGAMQTFALQSSDSAGFADLATTWVWFYTSFASSAANSCLAYYSRATNSLNLLNDAGTTWMAGTAGSAGSLTNNQCAIQLAATSVVTMGNTLTLNLPVVFSSSYSGAKHIYLFASGSLTNSGWQTQVPLTGP
jgi:hypothetical protein